jgi:hypothetical protein
MKTPASLKILLLAAVLPLFGGCASEPTTQVQPQVGTADNVFTGAPTTPPPDNKPDVIPAPPGPRTLLWFIPGHWEWRGQWAFVQGHWRTRPHPGDIWLPGIWVQQGGIYVWQKGSWRSGAPADEESTDVH